MEKTDQKSGRNKLFRDSMMELQSVRAENRYVKGRPSVALKWSSRGEGSEMSWKF